MKKTFFVPLLAMSLFTAHSAAFHSMAMAASDVKLAPSIQLYDGKTLAQDNLSVGDWGGGTVADSTDLFLFGGHSLKVTTLDPYQGAKISFLTPVALTGSGRVFQVTLQRGGVTLHYVPQAVPGAVQAGPQNAPGGFQGGGRGRRRGGGGNQFGGGNPYAGGSPYGNPYGNRFGGRGGNFTPQIPQITKLHLEFTLSDGRTADVLQAIPDTADTVAGDSWYSVNVPLASLKFGAGAGATLKSVTLAGDQYGVFFIGRMQIAPEAAVQPAKPAPADAPADDENGPPIGGPGFPGRRDEQN